MKTPILALLTLVVACGAPQAGEQPESAPTPDVEITLSESDESGTPAASGHHHGEHAVHGGHHHGFENPEEWASRWEGPERDAWQQPAQVIEWMQVEPGQTAVDIGAGTGYFLPHLSNAVGESGSVVCADIEQAMFEYLTARIEREGWTNASAVLATPVSPELEAGSVDRVLLVNTWHHIEGRLAYAAVLGEALAPGATLTIVEYNDTAQPGPPAEMRLTPEEVIGELEAAGYSAELLGRLERQYVVRATLNN